MDLVGNKIQHKTFGEGTILEIHERNVVVSFLGEKKKFVFPEAFRKFLILSDGESKNYIDSIIKDIDVVTNIKKEEVKRTEERAQRIKSFVVRQNSQAAFGCIENDPETVLQDWTAFAGKYRSGHSSGKPRIPDKLGLNSACLLTMCTDGKTESSRQIIGVFMVSNGFDGALCTDGKIYSHPSMRIALDINEEKLMFWDYFESKTDLAKAKWGASEIKYFSNIIMSDILRDMISVIKDKNKQNFAEEFFQYFCTVNKLDKDQLDN